MCAYEKDVFFMVLYGLRDNHLGPGHCARPAGPGLPGRQEHYSGLCYGDFPLQGTPVYLGRRRFLPACEFGLYGQGGKDGRQTRINRL